MPKGTRIDPIATTGVHMEHLQTLGSEFSPCCTRLYADDECGDYVVKVYRFGHFQPHEGHTTGNRKEAEGFALGLYKSAQLVPFGIQ